MKHLNNNALRKLGEERQLLQWEYDELEKKYESLKKRHIGLIILSLISIGVFITIINLI